MPKQEQKSICVCPRCKNPLISTMAFAHAEWFCLECRWMGGIFDNKAIDSTPALEEKKKADTEKFNLHRPNLWMGGERVAGCAKCENGKTGERHIHHLTDDEIQKSKAARAALGFKIN